jgi:hypothetical protein
MSDDERTLVTRYSPGTWLAVVGPTVWLLADLPPDGPVLDRCWPLIRGDADLADVVDAIFLDGLRSVDNLVLLHHRDGHGQLIVRGSATAMLSTEGDEPDEIRADGVSTWVERRFVGQGVEIRLGATAPQRTASLPLSSGAVLAGAIVIRSADLPGRVEPAPAVIVISPSDRTESLARSHNAPGPDEPQTYDFLFGVPPSSPPVVNGAARTRVVPMPDPDPQPATPQPGIGLIDSVPWARSEPPPPAMATADGDAAKTVNRATLLAATVPGHQLPLAGPTVQAVRCPNRHLSPPHATGCRVCGASIASQSTVVVPRPVLGVLRLSTGDLIRLDRAVVMGRAPGAADDTDPDRPHVLKLASPGDDISRTHLEVRLEDWHVLVVDLGSTNGTVVHVPGQQPERLRANDPRAIEPGTVVNLSDEIAFTFEVTA